jgi:hypothetical protein
VRSPRPFEWASARHEQSIGRGFGARMGYFTASCGRSPWIPFTPFTT